MHKDGKFWNKLADKYAKQPIGDQAAYQKKLSLSQSYFNPDAQVLEFGSGTGSTAIAHAPFVKHYLAIDISTRMIEISQDKAKAAGIENVTFKVSTINDLDLPDESLDVVLGLSILHLLANRDEVIAKVHRLLKPGGVFISSTVCLGDFMKIFKLIAPLGRAIGLLPVLKVFTAQDLQKAVTDAGFTLEHNLSMSKGRVVFLVAKK